MAKVPTNDTMMETEGINVALHESNVIQTDPIFTNPILNQ